MGGVNCLYELFQIDLSAKVVIISGHTPDDYTMQVLESCINGYLRKPYTREQLLHKVRMVLDVE